MNLIYSSYSGFVAVHNMLRALTVFIFQVKKTFLWFNGLVIACLMNLVVFNMWEFSFREERGENVSCVSGFCVEPSPHCPAMCVLNRESGSPALALCPVPCALWWCFRVPSSSHLRRVDRSRSENSSNSKFVNVYLYFLKVIVKNQQQFKSKAEGFYE